MSIFNKKMADNPNLPDEILRISEIKCKRYGLDKYPSAFTALSDFEQAEAAAKDAPALSKLKEFIEKAIPGLKEDKVVSYIDDNGDLKDRTVFAPTTAEKAYKSLVAILAGKGLIDIEDAGYMEDHFHLRNSVPPGIYDGDLWENFEKRQSIRQELAEIISQDRMKEAESLLSMSPFVERKNTLSDESLRFVYEYEQQHGNRDGVVKELVDYLVKSDIVDVMVRDGFIAAGKDKDSAETELVTKAVMFSVPEVNRVAKIEMERRLHEIIKQARERREEREAKEAKAKEDKRIAMEERRAKDPRNLGQE